MTGKADILSVNDCAKVSFSFSMAHRMGFLGEDGKILQDVYKGIDMGYSDDSFIWLYFKGHLAIIRDEETNNFVFSLTGGLRTWLGLRRVGPLVNPKPRYKEELYL